MLHAQLLVLAKEPLPGRAKTRLTPPLFPDEAAGIARAALLDTLDAVLETPVLRRTVVLDGSPDGWLPPGLDVIAQRTGAFAERLAGAYDDAFAARPLPMLLIGMDTPQVTPALLTDALDALLTEGTDAVLGLAEDGGWWTLGLRAPSPGLFDGIEMSTAETGNAQRVRLHQRGMSVSSMPTLRDVDAASDLGPVAALQSPPRRFAAAVDSLAQVAR